MKKPHGNEMRNFLIAASALVAVLIVAIVLITTFISVKTIDDEQTKAKQKDVDDVVLTAQKTAESLQEVQKDTRALQFMNPELMNSVLSGGDITEYMEGTIFILRAVGAYDYYAYVSDGKVVTFTTRRGLDPASIDVPVEIPAAGYNILDELGGVPGYYVELFAENIGSISMGENDFGVSVVDRTEEMAAIDEYYSNERSSLIGKQLLTGLIGLMVSLIICLVGLRLLTRYFITRPIEELQDVSRRLMEGTLGEGEEIVVDEKSDFADMQRLLKSGKLLLDKMNEVE